MMMSCVGIRISGCHLMQICFESDFESFMGLKNLIFLGVAIFRFYTIKIQNFQFSCI